jgi:hypothetical protein
MRTHIHKQVRTRTTQFVHLQLIAMATRHISGGSRIFSVAQAAQLAQLLANQAHQNAKDPNIR